MSELRSLAGNGGPEALGVVRVVVFGAWLVWLLVLPIERLAGVPLDLYQPAGLMHLVPSTWLDTLLSAHALSIFRWMLAALLIAAVLGARPFPPIGVSCVLGVVAFDSLMKSYQSYTNHAQLALLLSGFLIATAPAADGFSVMGRRRSARPPAYDFPIFGIAAVLTLTYAFVGARRLAVGGLEIFLHDALPTYLALRSIEHARTAFDFGLLALSSPALAGAMKLGFFVTTLAEVASPVCLVSRRFRLVWLAVIVPFHIVTLLTMNIFFWENLLLIAVTLTALPYLATPRPPDSGESTPIVFYDGECGLCQRSVQWLQRHDPEGVLRYAPLEGETANRTLPALGRDRGAWSLMYQDEHGTYRASEGVLRAVKRLGGAWALAAAVALLVPRAVRDWVYRAIARNRYRWFGRADVCALPSPETRDRFLP